MTRRTRPCGLTRGPRPFGTDSNRLSPSAAQERIRQIVDHLAALNGQLATIHHGIQPDPDNVLAAELRAGVECVRTDLLGDAVVTLTALIGLTGADAQDRRVEAVSVVERIAAFG